MIYAGGFAATAAMKENARVSQRLDSMAQDQNNLIWLDMEMTGLNPETDRIIEVAMIATDSQLNVLGQSPVLVIHQPDSVLDAMDDWNKNTHGKSGLIAKVKASTLIAAEAEATLLAFMAEYVPARTTPMCGNTIHQDRRFMVRWMPQLEEYFHYRNLDVSTLKELCKRWRPEVARGVVKRGKHEALADIEESIEELKYYREHFLKV
uniref:Probable oligoribonuclease n=1 Tax=Anopheles coluzzii TaxID=1518534 RepID=A0A8W7P519_ANOCL